VPIASAFLEMLFGTFSALMRSQVHDRSSAKARSSMGDSVSVIDLDAMSCYLSLLNVFDCSPVIDQTEKQWAPHSRHEKALKVIIKWNIPEVA
jgi:hypothetical protein